MTAATRKRRQRRRERDGLVVLLVPVHEAALTDVLLATQRLDESGVGDRDALARAVAGLVDDWRAEKSVTRPAGIPESRGSPASSTQQRRQQCSPGSQPK